MHLHLGHMVASGIVHGLIYATIFKLSHKVGLLGMIVIAVIGIALIWVISKLFNNNQR